jgi:CRP-like cAMP-binding protein
MKEEFLRMIDIAKSTGPKKLTVACPYHASSLLSSLMAQKDGLAIPILVGDKNRIMHAAEEDDVDISSLEIIDIKDDQAACDKAVQLVAEGKADFVMKGLIDTSVILKAYLKPEFGMRTDKLLSHVAVFNPDSYGKILFVTDASMNIDPDLDQKRQIIDIFKTSTLLNKLPDKTIAEAFEDGTILLNKYKKDELIHIEGEICNSIEIVLDGRIVIDNIDSEGEIFRITELIKGDLLAGNIVFLDNPKYPMTITTTSDVTLAEIEKEKLLKLLNENKSFLKEFLKLIAENSKKLNQKVKEKSNIPLRQKILEYLNYEKEKQRTEDIILPYSKKFLAEKLGVQRTSLSRELKKMEKDKIITFNKRTIRIL